MGHPFLRGGQVDLPMARAEIVVTVPSLLSSFKLSRLGPVIGAFKQDRAPGLAGRLGAEAPLVPVQLSIAREGDTPLRQRFSIVRDRLFSATLLDMVLANVLLAHDGGGLEGTVSLEGRLKVDGWPELPVKSARAAAAGSGPAPLVVARQVATLYAALVGSPFIGERDVQVTLSARLDDQPRGLEIVGATPARARVRVGEEVAIDVRLRDRQSGALRRERFTWTVPALPAGSRVRGVVGDGAALMQARGAGGLAAARRASSGAELVLALAAIPDPQALHLWMGVGDAGWQVDAQPMPGLPPSVATVLARQGSSRTLRPAPDRGLTEDSRALPAVVSGAMRFQLEVY